MEYWFIGDRIYIRSHRNERRAPGGLVPLTIKENEEIHGLSWKKYRGC